MAELLQRIRDGCGMLGALSSAGLLVVHAQPATNALTPGASLVDALQHLSLPDAQHLALERNWDLLATVAGVDAATAQKIVAHEFPNPTLSLSPFKITLDNHPASTPDGNGIWDRNYDTILALNQLFEIGGKRRSRQLSAQAGYEAARAQFLDAK